MYIQHRNTVFSRLGCILNVFGVIEYGAVVVIIARGDRAADAGLGISEVCISTKCLFLLFFPLLFPFFFFLSYPSNIYFEAVYSTICRRKLQFSVI